MIANKLFSMIKPFFVSRGGNTLNTNDMIKNYVNICIQDIYTRHNRFFKNEAECIMDCKEDEEGNLIWKTRFPIENIIYAEVRHKDYRVNKIKHELKISFRSFRKVFWDPMQDVDANLGYDFIKTRKFFRGLANENNADFKDYYIYVEYIKAYRFLDFNTMKNEELPLPDKFIPPLLNMIYDYASPLSYFDGDNIVPRYQIAEKQLEIIRQSDGISDSTYFAPDKSA